MSTVELIDRATTAGLRLIPRGDTLRVRGPEPMPQELLDLLRQHKAAVLAELRRREHAGMPQPPNRICPSCTGGLQPDDPDDGLCSTCRWSFQHLEPRRVQ